jgi:hypothetical protein
VLPVRNRHVAGAGSFSIGTEARHVVLLRSSVGRPEQWRDLTKSVRMAIYLSCCGQVQPSGAV